MNTNTNQKLLLRIVFATLLVCLLFFGVQAFLNRNKTASLTIEAAPLDAKILVNGTSSKQGKRKVEPGTYSIEVRRDGFESYKKSIQLKKGSTEYVGSALAPSTEKTENWYDNHPDDQKMAEKISSINFDTASSEAAEVPIATRLPFVGPGTTFRIDYNGIGKDGKPGLVITYFDEESKAEALNWITFQGFKTEDYTLTFIDPSQVNENDIGD